MTEERAREIIREELAFLVRSDRVIFQKHAQFFDGRNIQLGRTNGTQIGTATDQKLGFFGATPVDKPDTITDPTGGSVVDVEARSKIGTIIDRLQELGLLT